VEKMKKILFVVTDRKSGGVSMVLEDILNNLSLDKYEIDLLIFNDDGNMIVDRIDNKINIIFGNNFFDTLDIPLSYFKKHFNLRLLFNKLRLMFLLKTGLIKKRLIKERKKILSKNYDVEIAFKDGFCAIFTSVGDTPKKIHWLHSTYAENDPTRHYRKVFNTVYEPFENIIAVSKETADGFSSHYGFEDKITVVKNIMDDKKIKEQGREPVKLSNKKYNFISVGRLASAKGYDRLLKVVSRLKEDGLFNDSFLTIVGDGPERENLFTLKDDLKLDCVHFTLNQINPYKFMAGADMYISSARCEPFGLVMGEALILNKPVLAVETSATSTIINDGYNGLITENSENGLYLMLKKVLEDEKLVKTLQYNALFYDYSDTNREIVETIENILDK